jgi:hypothetical protein
MDAGQSGFKGLYKAATILTGVAVNRAADAPGVLAIVTGKATSGAIPMAPGVMAGLAAPSLMLNFHSVHALALFQALRSQAKYGDLREQLRGIEPVMSRLIRVIEDSIRESSPVPSTLPSQDASILFDPKRLTAYRAATDALARQIREYVIVQDAVLDDVTRCLNEWNRFLQDLKNFLNTDRPRNVFENLMHISVHRERDWAWYHDETGFSSACNRLRNHRNSWAALLDLGLRPPLPRLTFH